MNFTNGYIQAALWSSTDDDGNPLDDKLSMEDIDLNTHLKMVQDCAAFMEKTKCPDDAQYGHDFWLTRNRHGAGFWDGDYPKKLGEKLTKVSDDFGEVFLYVNDDGKVQS